MKTGWSVKRMVVIYGSAIVLLIIYGFWEDGIICFLRSRYMQRYYPQMLIEFLTIALGIPTGLFVNSLVEKKKNNKILVSILTFIKTELVSNQKNVMNLQLAAENVVSLSDISTRDMSALGTFTSILSQESYIAAQSSTAFTSISNDILMDNIVNAYLNIQRITGGSIGIEKIEPEERKVVLIAYIKLCERSKKSIKTCILEIDKELRKMNKKLTITE